MALMLTFLGHAGVQLTDGTHTLVVDPFLTDNPAASTSADQVQCEFIALTHGHADHLGDTVAIAKANKATVYAGYELSQYLEEQGLTTEPGNPGGRIGTPFGSVAFTQAFHSSSFEGRYLGMPCGLVIEMGGVTVYHTGDTALFGDMKLIGEIYQPDIALICAGDRYTMGPELASRAAELIDPSIAVPIHHGTWPAIEVDIARFAPVGIPVRVLQPGESLAHQ